MRTNCIAFSILIAGATSLPAATCFADAIPGVTIVDGSTLFNGSSSSPAGNFFSTVPGTVTPTTITGGGSTGSGLASGSITMTGAVAVGLEETFVTLDGFAQASQPAGYAGFVTVNVGFSLPDFTSDPIIIHLPQGAFYKILNAGQQSVSFTAVTGSIGATTLGPGTYKISCLFGTTLSQPATYVEKTLDWTLRLSTEALTNLPADLNTDGQVNAADLALLLAAWGTTAADINGNGTTSADDLAIVLAAWG